MRPRTATIQVSKEGDMWKVEVGDPHASTPLIVETSTDLDDAVIEAVFKWVDKEGLGD